MALQPATHRPAPGSALSAIPLFSGVGEEQLRSLAGAGTTLALGRRQIVFREGDLADGLYSVLAGELRIYRQAADGSEVELRRVAAGECFGEMALLDGGTRSASVETVTPCRLFRLSREAFLALLPRYPKLLGSLLASLTEHIRTTSQRVLREELEQRALRAEMEVEKYRSLTQMVAGVAHEINTPLGIVNTAASVVQQRLRSNELTAATRDPAARAIVEDVREAADLMQANVQRAHKLVRDFKQLSVSQIVDTLEQLSLCDVVEDAVGLFRISARQAHLDIEVCHTLADRAAGTWLGYRGYLTQVLLNLLTNVERYAYPRGSGGRVEIVVGEADAEHFIVTVRDFGRGIHPEALRRVFEPFFTTGRGNGATGLGMAIVYNIVTSGLRGTVELVSEPERGTTVNVTFSKTIPDPLHPRR